MSTLSTQSNRRNRRTPRAAIDPRPQPGTAATTDDAAARAHDAAQAFDRRLHAALAPLSAGLSPVSLALAAIDWSLHLATQPATATLLAWRAQQQALGWFLRSGGVDADGDGGPEDPRFADPAWRQWPWSAVAPASRAAERWWDEATALRGVEPHHREMVRFFARQWLDLLSPANLGPANPQVLAATQRQLGGNLVSGALNAVDDWRHDQGLPTLRDGGPASTPGVDVAVTPGRVVHRNALVELIQYRSQTPTVQAEPVFIVPSWIMKYYILDLSPHNSLVKWLVGQGHTVFILSWRNPDASDALLDMDDYVELGVLDSLAAIARECPGEAVQACGYCLGGTLLALAAAAMARPGGVRGAAPLPALASLTLLAAETDFSEPGEMGVLIDESQVTLLEDMMAERGFLTGPQMAGSFAYLHSREQVWSHRLRELWLGESEHPNDLMAWNADLTRMPAAMHSEYLRRCYLRNEIAQGRFPVQGRPVSLTDLHRPMFVVGTEKDHVSPWKSVYKLHHLTDAEITFVLTSGGHNAGIVSEPGHAGRHHAIARSARGAPRLDADAWQRDAARHEGSWWPAWHDWLLQQGSRRQLPARQPAQRPDLGDAPGRYVGVRYHDPA